MWFVVGLPRTRSPGRAQLVDRGAGVFRPPMEVRRLADVVLPQDLGDRDPRLALLQDADDLALREPGLPHGLLLSTPRKSTSELSTRRGSLRPDQSIRGSIERYDQCPLHLDSRCGANFSIRFFFISNSSGWLIVSKIFETGTTMAIPMLIFSLVNGGVVSLT